MSDPTHSPAASSRVVMLSSTKFLVGCALASAALLAFGHFVGIPRAVAPWLLAAEVFSTILALFLLGSFKYQVHKNPLTYGMGLVVLCTFIACRGPRGAWADITTDFPQAGKAADLFTFHALEGVFRGFDKLVHLDTMLFILGLTLFVCVIAQTRLLEQITFFLLRRNRGHVLPTVIAVTAVVSFASGILDGVSMIGLTIRTLVIILVLAHAPLPSIRYAVMVCTVVTTVCGMWLAYGEPPNLIMKANLISPEGRPYLTDGFFLRYCLPGAVVSYLCVAWSVRGRLRGMKVELEKLDVLDANAGTVRFLQAAQHGEVFTPVEWVQEHGGKLGDKQSAVLERVRQGEPLGAAMVREGIEPQVRRSLLSHYVSEDLADELDRHYELEVAGMSPGIDEGEAAVQQAMDDLRHRRVLAQRVGAAALLPFVGLLVAHGFNHEVPLFLASFAGFAVAVLGISSLRRMRALALREAKHEYAEYYFLFPLFLSITLLTKAGFFDQLQTLIQQGVASGRTTLLALAQFYGATALSAILDNNVVADFASRALHNLDLAVLHLFAMAQIAGYAAGGCWTHIGSAQSVVAYAFIKRDLDDRYTPIQWIKEMTPVLLSIVVALSALIVLESLLLRWLD